MNRSGFEEIVSRTQYDPTLFEGTASYYARYRLGYPQALFDHLVETFHLDGRGRALDLGCGTGALAFGLAPHFETVIGMDPDESMLEEARKSAAVNGVRNVNFVQGTSWDLSPGIGTFRLTAIGQAFHWMDRDSTLKTLHQMTSPGGGVAIVMEKFHMPPGYEETVHSVLTHFLGEQRRAGQGHYWHPAERHEVVFQRSPYRQLDSWTYEYELNWPIQQALGYLYSTSYSARRLFGDQVHEFESELERRLRTLEPGGVFKFRVVVSAMLGRKE